MEPWVGGADNWPESPMFSYRGAAANAPLLLGIGMVGSPLLLLAFGGLNVLSVLMPDIMVGWERTRSLGSMFVMARRDKTAFVICAAIAVYGLLASIFGLWFARRMALLRPALAITADGVFAYRRGRQWRSIAWREAESITRRQTRGKYGQTFTAVRIQGPRFALEMGEKIDGYDEARRLLTRFAHQHGIKLRAVAPGVSAYELVEL